MLSGKDPHHLFSAEHRRTPYGGAQLPRHQHGAAHIGIAFPADHVLFRGGIVYAAVDGHSVVYTALGAFQQLPQGAVPGQSLLPFIMDNVGLQPAHAGIRLTHQAGEHLFQPALRHHKAHILPELHPAESHILQPGKVPLLRQLPGKGQQRRPFKVQLGRNGGNQRGRSFPKGAGLGGKDHELLFPRFPFRGLVRPLLLIHNEYKPVGQGIPPLNADVHHIAVSIQGQTLYAPGGFLFSHTGSLLFFPEPKAPGSSSPQGSAPSSHPQR